VIKCCVMLCILSFVWWCSVGRCFVSGERSVVVVSSVVCSVGFFVIFVLVVLL